MAKYIVEKSLCLRKRTSLKRISVFLPNQAKIRLKKIVEKIIKCFDIKNKIKCVFSPNQAKIRLKKKKKC